MKRRNLTNEGEVEKKKGLSFVFTIILLVVRAKLASLQRQRENERKQVGNKSKAENFTTCFAILRVNIITLCVYVCLHGIIMNRIFNEKGFFLFA